MKRKMMENDKLQEISKKKNLKLAPETMRIRDAIIEKYSDTPGTPVDAVVVDIPFKESFNANTREVVKG